MFQESFNRFLIYVLEGVLGLLGAFLIALVKKGFDWLSAKIDNIKSDTAKSKLREALDLLQSNVISTVTSLQQTLGDDIKESIRLNDGKYTREDLLALKDQALNTILSQLSDGVLITLSDAYDNINDLIGDMIEVQVRELKFEKIAGSRMLLSE